MKKYVITGILLVFAAAVIVLFTPKTARAGFAQQFNAPDIYQPTIFCAWFGPSAGANAYQNGIHDFAILDNGSGAGALSSSCYSAFTTTTSRQAGRFIANGTLGANSASIFSSSATFTGGTGTTTVPTLYYNCTGSTSVSTWSTNGTVDGINACNGFTGNLIDLHVNGGPSVFKVDYEGNVTGNFTHPHTDTWSVPTAAFATTTGLGAVFYEPYASTITGMTARLSGIISCSVAPTVVVLDMGTSAATLYGSSTVLQSLNTGTSAGGFATTGLNVSVTAGHYLGFGISAGTCTTPPQIDSTISIQ